jgi:hypothetical protein
VESDDSARHITSSEASWGEEASEGMSDAGEDVETTTAAPTSRPLRLTATDESRTSSEADRVVLPGRGPISVSRIIE